MRYVAITLGMATIAACSPHRVTVSPPPPMPVPESYGQVASGAPMPEKWWSDFGDPELAGLIAQSLGGNFQIRAAWARVKQARALVTQANSGKYPQVDASVGAARQKSRFKFNIGGVGQEFTQTTNQFSASIAAGYEVDLWNRMANQGNAAAVDALALRDDVEAIALSLAAEVTEAWFDLVVQRAQKKLLSEQAVTNQTYLELVELRFQKGLASALDVYQQRQQVVATRAQLTQIDMAIRLLEQRLAILVGKPPQGLAFAGRDALPALPGAVPGVGLPADLLERRPDIRAARRRVEAADYRVAVAVANRLPALRLSGSMGLQATEIADFLSSPVWNLLASVTAPLFDGGRRKAEVERTKAVVEERLMAYGQALLQAMIEVESAMFQEQQQHAYIAELAQTVELSQATLREAQERYRQGLIDYLPVLTALQGQQRAEQNLLLAQRKLLSYRVQLCRALGGTWTQELTEPPSAGDQPEREETSL